ncbi:methyltransferase domain-containing protein [Rubritalea sp.]|uniref:methyltransferase domain-containing protein n=1 Tax=Rubritalea sp. TaxID=2109375 RepID=UPI003EFA7D19
MDWQSRYQTGDTPWDKGAVTPVLSELIELKPLCFGSLRRIFVPGCGLGYDALALAETGSTVLGFDIAPMAIERAREAVSGDVDLKYEVGDIFKLSKELIGDFDLVWEHTCFCALDPSFRSQYVEQMWSVLKPNTALLGVFFTNPDVSPNGGPPFGATREEIIKFFSLRFSLEWEREPSRFYEGREGREHVILFRRLPDHSDYSRF